MRAIAADGSSFFGHTVWQVRFHENVGDDGAVALADTLGAENRPREPAQIFGHPSTSSG